MRTAKWIIFGMLVALLAGCSGRKTAETSADAKNAESTDEKNTLDFVDAHGERYTVEINEAVAKNPYDKALFVKNENKVSYEDKLEREKKMQEAVLSIKKKYGKNAILKGLNFQEGATTKARNEQIGGHKA